MTIPSLLKIINKSREANGLGSISTQSIHSAVKSRLVAGKHYEQTGAGSPIFLFPEAEKYLKIYFRADD